MIKFPKTFYPLTLSNWTTSGNNYKSFSISADHILTFTSYTVVGAVTYDNYCYSPNIDFDKYNHIKLKGSAYTGGGAYNYGEIYLIDAKNTKISLYYFSVGESSSTSKTLDTNLDISNLTGSGKLVIHLWPKHANNANVKISVLEFD